MHPLKVLCTSNIDNANIGRNIVNCFRLYICILNQKCDAFSRKFEIQWIENILNLILFKKIIILGSP